MAFDLNNPADLIVLRDEEALDPIGMDYALVSGQTNKTLDLFNDPENNVGEDLDDYISEIFTSEVALDVIDATELTVGAKFSEGQSAWLGYLFAAADSLGEKFALFEPKFRALFSAYTPSSNTLDALDARNRKISRAERLFGVGTFITRDDWLAARDYQGSV